MSAAFLLAPRYRIVGSKVFDAKTGDELSGLNIKAIQAADVTWRSLGPGIQDAYEYAMWVSSKRSLT